MVRLALFGFALIPFLAHHATGDEISSIAEIEKLGGTVRTIAANDDSKDVDFHLSGTKLTDEGLAHAAPLKKLVWLNLKDTAVTDAGLQHLAGLTDLTRLHLERTAVTDAGLVHLKGLANLQYLNLYGTKVTDAGMDHLAGLKNLKRLYLWQSEVTDEGADKLAKALPDLVINRGADLAPAATAQQPPADEKPPTKLLANGQFVRVRLEGAGRILTLAEVQVIEIGTGNQFQTTGTAKQSSVGTGGEAARAHDGKTDQVYGSGTSTHTNAEDNPWWMVDLGKATDIGRVKLWNRSDCCGDRLAGAVVEILAADQKVVWTGKVEGAANGSVHDFDQK